MSKFSKLLLPCMAIMAASGYGGSSRYYDIESKSVEDIIEERRKRGLKPSYVSKPVKPYHGKKKLSRKKRKQLTEKFKSEKK